MRALLNCYETPCSDRAVKKGRCILHYSRFRAGLVEVKERRRLWRESPAGRASKKAARVKWLKTPKGKLYLKKKKARYYKSDKGKAYLERKRRKYVNSPNGKAKIVAKQKQYYDKLEKATPRWADTAKIKLFYKTCPPGMVVDHVIPLQGKNVSGLHVLENLQYLPRSVNAKKSNSFE